MGTHFITPWGFMAQAPTKTKPKKEKKSNKKPKEETPEAKAKREKKEQEEKLKQEKKAEEEKIKKAEKAKMDAFKKEQRKGNQANCLRGMGNLCKRVLANYNLNASLLSGRACYCPTTWPQVISKLGAAIAKAGSLAEKLRNMPLGLGGQLVFGCVSNFIAEISLAKPEFQRVEPNHTIIIYTGLS